VLTSPSPRRGRRRQPRSLRQEYSEFILERIEEFKQQISREKLLSIADEAVRELDAGSQEQLVLTEVLVLEHVDRLITRRLNLPSYRRWRERHLKLRRAQREPTHWGLDAHSRLVDLARNNDLEGDALVVGAGAAPSAFYLAANDWSVVFIDSEVSRVEAIETRAAAEALAFRFQAYVVGLGSWFPDVHPALTVLDPRTLARVDADDRERFIETLKERTVSGGAHHLWDLEQTSDVIALAPEAVKAHYGGWQIERLRSGARRSFVAIKP
jgi:hypothetical protein